MAKLAKKSSQKEGFNETVKAIKEEERARMNDAVTAEDGVVYDEPMLAGYTDEDGTFHNTFAYRETNGHDEEAINKPEVRENPGRVMTTLAERCVLQIGTLTKKELGPVKWGKVIRNLLVGDLSYMNFKIRELSKGRTIEFTHKCPKCKAKMVTEVTTDEFTVTPFDGDYEKPFNLRRGVRGNDGVYHKTGFVKPMNGYDAEIVLPKLRTNRATGMTLLMSRVMEMEDEGNGFSLTNNMVAGMTTHDRDTITEIIGDMAFGVKLDVEITCTNCGEDLTMEVGQSDFF